jgi:hypothetical protein
MYSLDKLTPEEKDQAKQYVNAIKETKKALKELMSKCKMEEKKEGGNMSTGLMLKKEVKKK